MTDSDSSGRWQEIRTLHRDHRFFYRILGGAVLVGLGVLIGASLFAEKQLDYLMSLFTNILIVAFGALVLDQRAKQREEERYKRDLIYRLGSKVNHEAIRAAEELKRHDWWKDGSLNGAYLKGAELQKANLVLGDFRGIQLIDANLQEADLSAANLQHADLSYTKMQKAALRGAKLQYADLTCANLRGASLIAARLDNTKLKRNFVEFDESTILPDGTNWTPNTDMTRFTDPNHPNFWRSDDPSSPAYRGKKTN